MFYNDSARITESVKLQEDVEQVKQTLTYRYIWIFVKHVDIISTDI